METDDNFWKQLEPVHSVAERFCRRLAGNRADGDDLYQDAVVRGYAGFSKLADPTKFRPWFFRIVTNIYRDRFRRPWWRRMVPIEPLSDSLAEAADRSGSHEARSLVEWAMRTLSTDDRALVTLFELEEWSVRELADLYGTPVGTIKARLSRARIKMRTALMRTHPSLAGAKKTTLQPNEARICVVTKPSRE